MYIVDIVIVLSAIIGLYKPVRFSVISDHLVSWFSVISDHLVSWSWFSGISGLASYGLVLYQII